MASEAKGMKLVLLLVVIVGLGAVVGAIVVGSISFEGIVTESPYEEGLKRDERRHALMRLGWMVQLETESFRVGSAEVPFTIKLQDGSPLKGANVDLKLSRPNTNEFDNHYEVTSDGEGHYRATVIFPLYGYWDMVFDIRKDGEILVHTQRVFAEDPDREKAGARE